MVTQILSGFDSAPTSLTTRALANNFNLEEKERREQAQKNKDFFYGKQESDIVLMNDDVEPIVLNLTKPIMTKRCSMLYGRPLVREFDGPSTSVNFLEDVYAENYIDALLQKVDLLSELTGSALIHPIYDETLEHGVRLAIYDATQFSTLGSDNDPSTADAISLLRVVDRLIDPDVAGAGDFKQPQVERSLQQQVWTPSTVQFYEGSIKIAEEENPLGFLPFVNFKGEEVHDQYIGYPTATHVRNLNAHINTLLTHLGYTIKMQAGTPIVFSGFKSGETVVVHPGRAVNIPEGAAASVLNLAPKLHETLESINWLEDRIYTTSSVPKISVEGGEGESGRELLVRWFPLMQVFKEKSTRFERYELQLANLILKVAGYEPIEEINILWPEEQVLPLNGEMDTLEQDIRLNITTPVDEILRRNPHMSDEDAVDVYYTNQLLNKTIKKGEDDSGNDPQTETE